VSVNQSMRRPR